MPVAFVPRRELTFMERSGRRFLLSIRGSPKTEVNMKAALEGIKTAGLQALKEIETLDALESLRLNILGVGGS